MKKKVKGKQKNITSLFDQGIYIIITLSISSNDIFDEISLVQV
jgi:hypothetical protein